MSIKTYSAHGNIHVGTTGFTNYIPGGADKQAAVRAQVFADYPNAVIMNGKDDWYAPVHERPASLARHYKLTPIAWYHTGISGISKSGVVLHEEDYELLVARCVAEEGCEPVAKVYRREDA